MNKAETILAHHGVKGMRWGVKGGAKKMPGSEDHVRVALASAKLKKGGIRALSNKELQDIVTRKNLERQYGQLNPSFKSTAGKFVADTLVSIGKQQVSTLVAKGVAKGGEKLLQKAASKA
jgi:hypothetical protein